MMFTAKKTNYSCHDSIWHDVTHGMIWHMIWYDVIWYNIWRCMIQNMVHITLNLQCQSN